MRIKRINVNRTRDLAKQTAGIRLRSFIFLSSIKVNGEKQLPLRVLNMMIFLNQKTLMVFLKGKQNKEASTRWCTRICCGIFT